MPICIVKISTVMPTAQVLMGVGTMLTGSTRQVKLFIFSLQGVLIIGVEDPCGTDSEAHW